MVNLERNHFSLYHATKAILYVFGTHHPHVIYYVLFVHASLHKDFTYLFQTDFTCFQIFVYDALGLLVLSI